uniref:TTKRSYEDQ domain-containing protein n=2 Tax=Mesocestoides corti TaxID=53468 RepID=A0A5K3FTX8_MESCO
MHEMAVSDTSSESKSLIKEIRFVARELRSLLTSSPQESTQVDEYDSFTDLNPASFVTDVIGVTPSMAEKNPSITDITALRNCKTLDLWKLESLAQYSMLRAAFDSFVPVANDVEVLSKVCQELIAILTKVLKCVNIEDFVQISEGYRRACEENAYLGLQMACLKCKGSTAILSQPPGRLPKSKGIGLNETVVFEVVERMCDEMEEERNRLETEIQNTREDLKRANESLEVSQKTISYIKSQLESTRLQSRRLEKTSAEAMEILRDITSELGSFEQKETIFQTANNIKVWVKGLLKTFPWIRSWKESDHLLEIRDCHVNPYLLLHQKEKVLSENMRSIAAASSFIEDLGIEVNEIKSDRARLRSELEKKELALRKLQEESDEKSVQIDRYRATFNALFEPNTAANFAKQVAEQYKRHRNKSFTQKTIPSHSSSSTSHGITPVGCMQNEPQNRDHQPPAPLIPTSTQQPCVPPDVSPHTARVATYKFPPSQRTANNDKENEADTVNTPKASPTPSTTQKKHVFESSHKNVFKKPFEVPTTPSEVVDSKRIKLSEETPTHVPGGSSCNVPLTATVTLPVANTGQAKFTPPNPTFEDRLCPKPSISKPPPTRTSQSSNVKYDPGCPTS